MRSGRLQRSPMELVDVLARCEEHCGYAVEAAVTGAASCGSARGCCEGRGCGRRTAREEEEVVREEEKEVVRTVFSFFYREAD